MAYEYIDLTDEEIQAEMAKNEAIYAEFSRRMRLAQAPSTFFETLLNAKRDLVDVAATLVEVVDWTPRGFYQHGNDADADEPLFSREDIERLAQLLQDHLAETAE